MEEAGSGELTNNTYIEDAYSNLSSQKYSDLQEYDKSCVQDELDPEENMSHQEIEKLKKTEMPSLLFIVAIAIAVSCMLL